MGKKTIVWSETMPDLLSQWNYDKNIIKPQDITKWSKEKIWWKCELGHEWISSMNNRLKNVGCPYCSGRLPIVGETDLETTNPELLLEWDYEKNDISPNMVKSGSQNRVWWKCKSGHSWLASPNQRKKNGCPYCSGKKVLVGYNDLATVRPDIVKEWDCSKNGNNSPDKLTVRSGKRIWWKCKNGHSWEAVIASRTGEKKVGCPYCSGLLPIARETDLMTTNPELINEWDYEKNKDITLQMVKAGSKKKVWWKCNKGHVWEAAISSRAKGENGCPYCSGRYAIKGENDLESIGGKLIEEWDYTKNKTIRPENVKISSGKKVWWKCKLGHQWCASIASRSKGSSCPYCSGRKVLTGFNDLAYKYPNIAKEWNYDKNDGLLPENVTSKSGIKVWWKCEKNHEWLAIISNRSRGDGCPICSAGIRTSFPEQAIFYYIKMKYPDAINRYIGELSSNKELDIFIPSMRLGIEYDGRAWHNSELAMKKEVKKYMECKRQGITLIRTKEENGNYVSNSCDVLLRISEDYGNESYRSLFEKLGKYIDVPNNIDVDNDRTNILQNYKTYIKNRSFGNKFPDLVEEWDVEKNGSLTPFMFEVNSGEKVWWKCKYGHSWRTAIAIRSKGSGCPYCSGRYAIKGKNDLETLRRDISIEWNYEKNGELKPSDVKCQSNKKVWWKCNCGHEWQAVIYNRTNKGNSCPFCKKQKDL